MRRLIAMTVLFLASCGGGSSGSNSTNGLSVPEVDIQRDITQGSWNIENVTPGCDEFYLFGNTGEMRIFSNQEFVQASYSINREEMGRDELQFQVISDNSGQDCEGDSLNDTGVTVGPLYVEYRGSAMYWYDSPTGGSLLATMQYIEQNLTPLISSENSLELVSIDPDTASAGFLTQFTVTLSYAVSSDLRLRVGFNDIYRDIYIIQYSLDLSAGEAGETTFMIEGTPFDWGEGNAYVLFATLGPPTGPSVSSIRQVIQISQ